MGPEDHGLPPDNFQETPEPRVAHRTSPTNIGMGLLATLAAHDLGFIRTDELALRIDATLTTMEGLERFEGHLLNWYDTLSLAPLPPSYVSTVDSGNLAGALMALAEGLRQLSRQPQTAAQPSTESAVDHSGRLEELARRAAAFADGMNFRFLYDPQRRILSIGYRLPDAEGPGRLDPSFYDLLASEARLASFIAIAKGDLPETHWFHLGRLITSVDGTPTLLSWSATLFEYLMPLLVMKSYPETLLDQTCRMAVRRQMEYARDRCVPVGHVGVRLQPRGPPRQLPVQGLRRPRPRPEAGPGRRAGGGAVRDRARRHGRSDGGCPEPAAPCAPRGSRARTATTRRSTTRTTGPTSARAPRTKRALRRGTSCGRYMAHHQGMTLVALANALLGDPMVKRFHADPRVQATELLLQERVPRHAPITRAAAGRRNARGGPDAGSGRAPLPVGAHAVPVRAVPVQRQLHHRRDECRRRRQLLPGPRGDPAPRGSDPRPGKPVPLPARCAERGGVVGHLSADREGAGGLRGRRSSRRRRPSGAATTTSPRSSISRSRPRTTSRCAGCP